MRTAVLALALAGALAAHPVVASAESTSYPPPRRRDLMILDGFSLFLTAAGVPTFAPEPEDDPAVEQASCNELQFWAPVFLVGGAAGYLVGGPVLHHEHGQRGRTLLSAALRLTLPIVSGLAAHRVASGAGPVILGVGAGMATAMALDWTVLW